MDQVDVELASEGLFDLFGLAGAHEAGVDEHARELVTDRLVHEGSGDCRVHPAREGAQHALGADLGLDRRDLGLDDRDVGPQRGDGADVVEEALEEVRAAIGVDDLGMELDAVDAPLGIPEGRHRRVRGRGGRFHARRGGRDAVAVAHPDLGGRRPVTEQR